MRKILTFLFAALMSVGMWADPIVVEWSSDDIFGPGSGTSFQKDGVTLTCTNIDNGAIWCIDDPGTFTTTLGNFSMIEITTGWGGPDGWEESSVCVGWDDEEEQWKYIPKWTWTGDAASVSFNGDFGGLSSIVFTIGPAAPAGPSWLREGDEWNDDTKTLTVNSNLPNNAYQKNKEIEHVIISSGVTSIGGNAFLNCNYMQSVTIPYGVTSIGASAFFGCDELTSFTIPNSVTSIGNAAFCWCSGLTSITIPNSVTSIGGEAFRYCTGLTSITIPNSVTSIGGAAFMDCYGLASMVVVSGNTNYDSRDNCNAIIETSTNKLIAGCKNSIIPNSVTSIGVNAFYSCYGLTSITIPNSVTSIGNAAFAWCEGLTSVTIGNSVNSIGEYAFRNCTALQSIYIAAVTPPSLGGSVFGSIDNKSNIPLYVPFGSVAAYQAAAQWNEFNIKAMITPNVDPQNADVYYCTVYDSQVKYALPEGVEAYVATLSGANLLLTKIAEAGEVIPADNAVIFKSSVTPITLSPSEADAVTFSATNNLQGTDEEKAKPANCYVLSCENNLVGFYQYNGAKVAAHKAYVIYSGSNQAPRRMPFIFDATTDVENVQGNVQSTKVLRDGQLIIIRNGVEYNANGMMVK